MSIRFVFHVHAWHHSTRPKHLVLDPAVAEALLNVFGAPVVRCGARAVHLARLRAQEPVVVVRRTS